MKSERNYEEALAYLYGFIDYSLEREYRYAPEHFELGRLRDFLAALGNPQAQYPIIHIAGTKGKGSVAALCASALQAAGYRVGLYTSPHLEDYAERIRINHNPIPHPDFVALMEELRPLLEKDTGLTAFEITTALALLYFARQGVTAAVLEVGLGGRLDATNVVQPITTIIASVSYDHTAFLGETLAEIAAEKAGIIKPGVPVVVGPQKEEARLVIERIAAERGAPLLQVGRDYLYAQVSRSLDGQSFLVWPVSDQTLVNEYIESGGLHEWEPVRLSTPLLGYHQVENAATAYTALQAARKYGLEIQADDIRAGFSRVEWPARLEVLRRKPTIVVDSAHNRDSALKLRLALDDYFPGQPVVMVFGASMDKDLEGMFAELMPRINRVIAVRSKHPRAMEPEEIVRMAHRFGRPAHLIQEIDEAIDEALRLAQGEALILVAGSLFVAAEARRVILMNFRQRSL